MSEKSSTITERPPVVAIMGHVDHGKSSLLDYIRKTNIVAGEAGGITQRVSAYEVVHKNTSGIDRKITFIDTPGHAAFSGMRQRGANIADIAILIISAEDSVKAQTIEAINIIHESKVPFIVAVTKIDKPNAHADKIKTDLLEHGVYLEGYGGDISCVEVSSKSGAGINELLELILLLAEIQEFTGDPTLPAEGYILESHLDPKRGVDATLIIKNGTIKKGEFVVAGCGMAVTRILEDFTGKNIEEATFSSPIHIVGFSTACAAGGIFNVYGNKADAEEAVANAAPEGYVTTLPTNLDPETIIVPIILKCDLIGMIEAIAGEIEKLSSDGIYFKIIRSGVGDINESDMQIASTDAGTIIIGFNVKEDKKIVNINNYDQVMIKVFTIIYKINEWLSDIKEARRHRKQVEKIHGVGKILKVFSLSKKGHVIGVRVKSGILKTGDKVHILRRDEHVAQGIIDNIQVGKMPATSVTDDMECGINLNTNVDVTEGDHIESFEIITE